MPFPNTPQCSHHSVHTLSNKPQCSFPTNLSVHTQIYLGVHNISNSPHSVCIHIVPTNFTVSISFPTHLTVFIPFPNTSQFSDPSQTSHSYYTLPNIYQCSHPSNKPQCLRSSQFSSVFITVLTHLTVGVFILFPYIPQCPYPSQHTSQYSYPSKHTTKYSYPSRHFLDIHIYYTFLRFSLSTISF